MPTTLALGAISYPRTRIRESRRANAPQLTFASMASEASCSGDGRKARKTRPDADSTTGTENPIGTTKLAALGCSTRATVTMRMPLGTLMWHEWPIAAASVRISG